MPWWSWVLIWTGLVLVLLAVLAVGAWWLFRKLQGVLAEAERLETVQAEFASLVDERVAPYEPAPLALLRSRDEVIAERELAVDRRNSRREQRRATKLARARALTHADPLQYAHLAQLHPKKG